MFTYSGDCIFPLNITVCIKEDIWMPGMLILSSMFLDYSLAVLCFMCCVLGFALVYDNGHINICNERVINQNGIQ